MSGSDPIVEMQPPRGNAPVTCDGRVNGHRFHFYARWDSWCFAISLDPSVDVEVMESEAGGFYRSGEYIIEGCRYAASRMPDDEVARLVMACALEFAAENHPAPNEDFDLEALPNLTGTWLGLAVDTSGPEHICTVQQRGRFLDIGLSLDPSTPRLVFYGKIDPAKREFNMFGPGATITGQIMDDDHFRAVGLARRMPIADKMRYDQILRVDDQVPCVDVIFRRVDAS